MNFFRLYDFGKCMKKGPYNETGRKTKYKNNWMRIQEASVVRPDGRRGKFGLVYMGEGATVLALDRALNVLLVKEYKYALERETIELVSGGICPGENVEEAGIRELLEETGYRARSVTRLGTVDPFSTVISCRNHILLAQDLIYDPLAAPPEDHLESFSVPFEAALQMVQRGEITHASSCVGLLLADKLFRGSQYNANGGLGWDGQRTSNLGYTPRQ